MIYIAMIVTFCAGEAFAHQNVGGTITWLATASMLMGLRWAWHNR